jgi:hypothetical protein
VIWAGRGGQQGGGLRPLMPGNSPGVPDIEELDGDPAAVTDQVGGAVALPLP